MCSRSIRRCPRAFLRHERERRAGRAVLTFAALGVGLLAPLLLLTAAWPLLQGLDTARWMDALGKTPRGNRSGALAVLLALVLASTSTGLRRLAASLVPRPGPWRGR